MKRNAITRIVIYSIVIVLLLGLLLTGLGIGRLAFDLDLGDGSYTTGGGSLPADGIQNLDIEWAAGSIMIQTADINSIEFTETGFTGTEMVYERRGDTLVIRYSEPRFLIGFVATSAKDLTITVPKNWFCSELSIDAAAASINISELSARTVDLDSASGECDFSDCEFETLDIDSASGDIHFTGTLENLDCDAASSDVTAVFSQAPRQITLDGASGELDLTLPADCGFSVEMQTLSGDFSSEQPTVYENGRHIYGDGSCRIDVDGLSGDVKIRKGN